MLIAFEVAECTFTCCCHSQARSIRTIGGTDGTGKITTVRKRHYVGTRARKLRCEGCWGLQVNHLAHAGAAWRRTSSFEMRSMPVKRAQDDAQFLNARDDNLVVQGAVAAVGDESPTYQ